MFFHIDESGNTGNNLFDQNQPVLSYGVISCRTNVDALCVQLHKQIVSLIDDDQIHANALGYGGLIKIAPVLMQIQRKMEFDFDYYFIHKPAFAVVTFFDAVFDAGLNEAVGWNWYWTPLRYLLVATLSQVLDEGMRRESWRLCTVKRIEKHEKEVVSLLQSVKDRIAGMQVDKRAKEIIVDAMDFGISNPLSLDFGFPDQKMISPNAVAFQFVSGAIARRVRKKNRKRASSVVVDRQAQFNKAQAETHKTQALLEDGLRKAPQQVRDRYLMQPLHSTLDQDQLLTRGLIDQELTVSSSVGSIGLQIVDVYLWMANKIRAGEELPVELQALCSMFLKRTVVDGISVGGMLERFRQFETLLPELEEFSDEQQQRAREQRDAHREKVRNLKSTGGNG